MRRESRRGRHIRMSCAHVRMDDESREVLKWAPAREGYSDVMCLEGSHYRSLKVESNHKDVVETGVQLVQSNAFSNAHLFGFWMSLVRG